ncbi:diacylglycerol kinase [Planctomycetales bacterium]|nr:diacylglycerol kinase [Planctomycetales bacterium]GHS98788.1 diacylglycerol kinase [Planctomycetales bacterium]GHT06551.1 diacylglycerol kinase [Planctomycetales bacterium]
MKPAHTGWRKIWHSLTYARDGFAAIWRDEVSFRQEVYLGGAALLALPFLPLNAIATGMLVAAIIGIWLAEIINSALEALADRISDERHALLKKAKDLGALLVLLAIVNAVIIWAVILAAAGWR